MRTAGLRLTSLLGAAFLMSCSSVPNSAEVRVQNDNAAAVGLVLTRSGGGAVTISSVPGGTMSSFVDLPLGFYTVTSSGSGIPVSGTTFVAVGTDNYTLLVSAGANATVTVKRE